MALTAPHRVDRVVHETLAFERQFNAPREAVFEALSDSVARAKWAAPSPTSVVIYNTENFTLRVKVDDKAGNDNSLYVGGRS